MSEMSPEPADGSLGSTNTTSTPPSPEQPPVPASVPFETPTTNPPERQNALNGEQPSLEGTIQGEQPRPVIYQNDFGAVYRENDGLWQIVTFTTEEERHTFCLDIEQRMKFKVVLLDPHHFGMIED